MNACYSVSNMVPKKISELTLFKIRILLPIVDQSTSQNT